MTDQAASRRNGRRPVARRRMLSRALLVFGVLGDLLAVNLAMLLAYWLRFRSGWIPVTKGEPLSAEAYLGAMVAVSLVWLVVSHWADMYRPQRWVNALDETYRVMIVAAAVLSLSMALSFLYRASEFSRLTAGIAVVIAVVLVSALRAWGLAVGAAVLRRPEFQRRVASVGVGSLAGHLAGRERALVHEVDPSALEQVIEAVAAGEVDEVVVARDGCHEEALLRLLRACEEAGADALIAASPLDLLLLRGGREDVAGYPLVRVRDVPLDGLQRLLKRLIDFVLALVILVLLSPLLVVLAVLVKLSGPGPVIYAQTRITEGGREFTIYKFRTMVQDAEKGTGAVWATKGDPRVTPIGRFLRRTSLDELPQVWNVLVGEMSLIGPRPERPTFVEEFAAQVPRYRDRHRMKAGITGWAQVNGQRGGDSEILVRTRYDLFYVDNWSLLLDLQITLKTFFEVLFHRGAG